MLSKHKEKIAHNFSKHHVQYNTRAQLQQDVAGRLAAYLPEMKCPKILEIGCGTGFLTRHLIDKYPGGSFDITDLSQAMVHHCENIYGQQPGTNFFVLDGEDIEKIKRNKYDLIMSSMAVQWFDTPVESLNMLRRIAPVYYTSLGEGSFREWKSCLHALGLPDGTLDFPNWPGVTEEQTIERQYESARHFLRTLKDIGTHSSKKGYSQLSYAEIVRAMRALEEQYQSSITWHVVYGALQ